MDEDKRRLQGSEKLDRFKRRHKEINGKFYASDVDLTLISKLPPGVVAYLDYKGSGENVTFAEVILYNQHLEIAPVYIVEGKDPENGPFTITRFMGGNYKPEPPTVDTETICTCADWSEYEKWESELREEYEKRGGWHGKLRKRLY